MLIRLLISGNILILNSMINHCLNLKDIMQVGRVKLYLCRFNPLFDYHS